MAAPPRMHGLSHRPGGSDPIPGLTGGGGGGPTGILFTWNGYLPITSGNQTVRHTPYAPDGSSLSFELTSYWFRIEETQSATITVRLEKSSAGGVFSPTTIVAPSIPAGSYEATGTIASFPIVSGDLVRLVQVTVPTVFTLTVYEVQLLGGVV